MKKTLLYGCGGSLVGGAVLLGLLAVVGSFIDDELNLHVESQLAASPEALYPFLTTQEGLIGWWGMAGATGSPTDGRVVLALPGPAEGVGVQIAVATDGAITEQWILNEAESLSRVRYTVDLQGFTVERTITLTPAESGTWVTWDDVGVIESPFMRFFMLLPEDILLSAPYSALSTLDSIAQ